MVSQLHRSFAWRHKQPIYFIRPQRAGTLLIIIWQDILALNEVSLENMCHSFINADTQTTLNVIPYGIGLLPSTINRSFKNHELGLGNELSVAKCINYLMNGLSLVFIKIICSH